MKKQIIRDQMLTRRRQLDDCSHLRLSRRAQDRLMVTPSFQQATKVALYSPIHHEVATQQIFSASLATGKQVFYPRVAGEELEFCRVFSLEDLTTGAFNVAEPVGQKNIAVADLDLIIVPGVVFSRDGFRLGYGRGFYDRQLAGRTVATVAIGLCFDFQLVDQLPVEEHDQQLDYIVTEKQSIPCRI